MKRPRNATHRTARASAKRARTRPEPGARKAKQAVRHALFGEIPLIPTLRVDAAGNQYESLDFDPDYEPPLPKGAVRGNVNSQEFCRMCHVPHYFYVDVECVCVQCKQPFVFRAAEQKYWYETLKFHFDSTAIRCVSCRRARRSEHAVHEALVAAREAAKLAPESPSAQLGLAEAIVRYFQRKNAGPLAAAIAASRKARRLVREHSGHDARESLFWEAMSHGLAGRREQARKLMQEFLDERGGGRRLTQLANEARRWLEAGGAV